MNLNLVTLVRSPSVSLEDRDANGLQGDQQASIVDRPADVNVTMTVASATATDDDEKVARESPMIVLVLDASGSMQSISNDIRGSVNSFINQQKAAPADGTKFSLIVFADKAETKINQIPIQDVSEITRDEYHCGGYTALYDAIGLAIDNHSDHKEALVVIVTDGEENKSRTTHDELQRKIAEKKASGWKFIYLANEPQVSRAGASIGLCAAAAGATTSATNNVAVGYANLAPVLERAVSSAVYAYRATTEVPNLNDLARSQTAPTNRTPSTGH